MIIIPAIDIKDGKVVRLSQGKFHEMTIYSDNPIAIAKKWQASGASFIHVVDLDGAETGEIKNFEIISQIAKSIDIPMQVGGGIRSQDDIFKLLDSGISRVVLGTKAIEDREFLAGVLDRWKAQITVSLDCTRGIVAEKGWTATSGLKATEFAKELQDMGLKHLIYTDIARDGMLRGPNMESITEILSCVNIPVIASGGISGIEDIINLKKLEPDGLAGIIIGKALYENRLYLHDAIDVCKRKE